ncbi:divalent-cation tolerance protein CutA [Streptomyces formicae]|uniref:Divalent-cation tolerance protein CutA n=2 Tax=Streptomyces formicae TaxID=1616117 RepID=A0ABY3X1H0_9ACTN|nr:divalent-cation tolerance protein CutA [Streptomyces formicae]
MHVSTSADTRDQAVVLAETAVRERLAAAGEVVGPVATYAWQDGQLIAGREYQALMKTRIDLYPTLEAHLVQQHPRPNPEVYAVPIDAAAAGYLAALDVNLQPPPDPVPET